MVSTRHLAVESVIAAPVDPPDPPKDLGPVCYVSALCGKFIQRAPRSARHCRQTGSSRAAPRSASPRRVAPRREASEP